MKYADLKICMTEYRAGNIEREDMVAAIALWQRPVEITKESYERAREKYELLGCYASAVLFDDLKLAEKRARAAVEAVIR